ncbi:Zinc metalloproteinase nas-7 [Folsomia candida]|uniref:Zinc metalloproteinase nas-7 n=1 Tax=Folsomia candida TaxID=158441 RepID=A0A226CXW3_FOLCA|nr:Zinc metalloproteinase nas-7 [Folsomia candida]
MRKERPVSTMELVPKLYRSKPSFKIVHFRRTRETVKTEYGAVPRYSYGDPRDDIHDIHKIGGKAASVPTWPNNVIPYEISPDFDYLDLTAIDIAIQDYHAKTCITWKRRTTESDYVQFFRNVS